MLLQKHPTTIMRAGMAFLVAASLALRFLPRWKGLNHDLADGVAGLLYGVAITLLLMSVWMRGKTR